MVDKTHNYMYMWLGIKQLKQVDMLIIILKRNASMQLHEIWMCFFPCAYSYSYIEELVDTFLDKGDVMGW